MFVWVFVCLFVEVLVRCSVSTIWRLCVNWWRLRNEPRHVNDPQTLVKANAQDSWTSHRLLKTLLTWRELTSCRLPRLLLTSITGKRVFPAFSHAFWCILQLVIHEKLNNLWTLHTRITWSIFHDMFSSSVASVAKLGQTPDTSTMPRVNKLETWEVFVHKSTPHNRHHKHQARSFVVKKILSFR